MSIHRNTPALVVGAFLAVVAAVTIPAVAANYGQFDDDGPQITAVGDGKTFDGTCHGKNVQLIGNAQRVVLHGTCGEVDSTGNHKHVRLDAARSLHVTGNDNHFVYKKKPASINTLGARNVFKSV